jgi:hypothetical protein
MPEYAKKTSVPISSSRAEIERTLERYGAESFAYGWDTEQAVIMFKYHGRQIRFVLPLPDRSSPEFTQYRPGGGYNLTRRSPEGAREKWEQAQRQRWRALALAIKAKLEVVEAGISTFESEFLAHIVLPNGQTFGEWATPELARVYELGEMPALLPASQDR